MSEKSGKEELKKVRDTGAGAGDEPTRDRIRQPLSTQKLLNRLFLTGIVGITGALVGCLVIFEVKCSGGWYVLPVLLAVIGVVMLVSAWNIRQGLVHSRLVKFMIKLMNAFRM